MPQINMRIPHLPIEMIALIFVGLMLTSAGLDRIVNARLRTGG